MIEMIQITAIVELLGTVGIDGICFSISLPGC
jgi:hypothetical protein